MQFSVRSVIQNAGVLFVGQTGANVLNVVSVAVLTRALGAEGFGVFVLLMSYYEIVNRTFNLQTWEAFVKFGTDALHNNQQDRFVGFFKYCLLVDVLSMGAASLVAMIGARFFLAFVRIDQAQLPLAYVLAASLLFNAAEISTGVFRIFDLFVLQARIIFLNALIRLSLIAFVFVVAPSLKAFVIATSASLAIAFLIKGTWAFKTLRDRVDWNLLRQVSIEWAEVRKTGMFRFIIFNNFTVLIRMLTRQLDVVILGRFFPKEAVGIYRLAVRICDVVGQLSQPVAQVLYPELTKMFAGGQLAKARHLTTRMCGLLASIMLLGFAVYGLCGQSVITWVFGEQFRETYFVGLIYLLSVIIGFSVNPLSSVILARGLAGRALVNMSVATVAFFGCLFVTVARFGSYGAAWSHAVFYVVWFWMAMDTIIRYRIFNEDAINHVRKATTNPSR